MKLTHHKAANIFPMIAGAEFEALKADIAANGLREPICVIGTEILDGRNRYRACVKLGIKDPLVAKYDGPTDMDALVTYVISLNLHRRHLNASQRAMAAERIATMRGGERTDLVQICTRSASQPTQSRRATATTAAAVEATPPQHKAKSKKAAPAVTTKTPPPSKAEVHKATAKSLQEAAETVNVGRRSVANARKVRTDGIPELAAAVEQGFVSVSAAVRISKGDKADQRRMLEVIDGGKVKPTEAARRVRKEKLAANPIHLPSDRYRVIYADPPWTYNDSRAGLTGYESTAAADHYPTMTVEELQALGVCKLAEKDAVLFCWATFPLLPDALKVVDAWGFRYKTSFVWAKGRPNMGHYHDASAELLLICTRGSCTPDSDKREHQVQQINRTGRHSAKPKSFREMIDRLYPHGQRIELFRRGPAVGTWEAWGNESE